MGKTYDIPVVEVFISGGQCQHVKIPQDANIKVVVRDYDIEDIEQAKEDGHVIKQDVDGDHYEEAVYEN